MGDKPRFLMATFNADETLTFARQAPQSSQAPASGCITIHGTYAKGPRSGLSGDPNTLQWLFTDGAYEISDCSYPPGDSTGPAVRAGDIPSFIDQGLIPPTKLIYTATSTDLDLSWGFVFTKAP